MFKRLKEFKKFLPFLAVFLGALVWRLLILNAGFHVDILSIAGWARWIFENGPKGFYDNTIWLFSWPTQPPLASLAYGLSAFLYEKLKWLFANMGVFIAVHRLAPTYFIWFFDFIRWFGEAAYGTLDYKIGLLLSLKLFPVLADLGIAFIIYYLAKKFVPQKALFFSALYLFSPFSWYLSSLWGQYDQLGFLFLIIAFLLLVKRKLVLAPAAFFLSIGIKPTSLIFVPLFVFLYFLRKPKPVEILLGGLITFGLFVYTTAMFTDKNLFEFGRSDLFRKIFLKSEFRVSTNSFNFWRVLIGNQALNQNTPFLLLPAKYWGYLAFTVLNLVSFQLARTKRLKEVVTAIFIIGTGGWLFLTNMLERYLFAGIASGILVVLYYPKIFKHWIVMSFIFALNLYHGWWFPETLGEPVKLLLTWREGVLTRGLSLINVVIFLRILYVLKIPLVKFAYKK